MPDSSAPSVPHSQGSKRPFLARGVNGRLLSPHRPSPRTASEIVRNDRARTICIAMIVGSVAMTVVATCERARPAPRL